MAPTLLPGDRLLVLRVPPFWPLRPATLVAVPDPRGPPDARILVKRVVGLDRDTVAVQGDNADQSTDSRVFGSVPRRSVIGLVVYRYAPPGRSGPIRPPAAR